MDTHRLILWVSIIIPYNYPYHLAFKYTLFLLLTIVYTILGE